jgi:hypothetical protein
MSVSEQRRLRGDSDVQTNTSSPTGGHTVTLPAAEEPWSLPITGQDANISFSYPNTPAPMAPPHHQPMSDVHNVSTEDLGFTTLEDWFNGTDGDVFGGLDLQDFWLQVGPGEVSLVSSGPMLTQRRKEVFRSAKMLPYMLLYVFFLGLSPKIRVPTRTLLLPSLTA